MTRLELERVVDDGLEPLSLCLEMGLWTLIGDSLSVLGGLIEILSGTRRARRGRALLDGRDILEDPTARRRIAALLPNESLLAAPRVSDSLELAAELRGAPLNGNVPLDRYGLARFASASPERLGPNERRALSLAFALSFDRVDALLLHDPFSLHALVPRQLVIDQCLALAGRACVVVTTTRIEDAIELGGSACLIERGRTAAHFGLAQDKGQSVGLVVRTEDAQRLAELCSTHSAVQHVLYDAQRSLRELLVFGADLSLLARALAELAHNAELSIDAFCPLVPPLTSRSA